MDFNNATSVLFLWVMDFYFVAIGLLLKKIFFLIIIGYLVANESQKLKHEFSVSIYLIGLFTNLSIFQLWGYLLKICNVSQRLQYKLTNTLCID